MYNHFNVSNHSLAFTPNFFKKSVIKKKIKWWFILLKSLQKNKEFELINCSLFILNSKKMRRKKLLTFEQKIF